MPNFIRVGNAFVDADRISHIVPGKVKDLEVMWIHVDTPTPTRIGVPADQADRIAFLLGVEGKIDAEWIEDVESR